MVEKEGMERELALIEERSKMLDLAKAVLGMVRDGMDGEEGSWEEVEQDISEDVKRIEGIEDASGAGTTRAYIEQLEAEIRMLRAGPDARCTGILRQALSGSEDADVDFVFDNGQIGGVKGHRGMLCAGSEEYAGLFRSGMVEAQEGKIRVPPCVGAESFRGFLEWLYLGELSAVLFALCMPVSSSAWRAVGVVPADM